MQATSQEPQAGGPMIDPKILRNVQLFADFDDEQLQHIANVMTGRTFRRGSFVVRQDDPGGVFYVILEGSLAVIRTAAQKRERILSILTANDFFGEMTIFDSSLRSASIKALTDVRVGILTEEAFLDSFEHNPKVARFLVAALSQRLRAANQFIAATMQHIPVRVASVLLSLAQHFGEPIEGGGLKVSLSLTNREMANMIGTTRETVNRTLNLFSDEGLIEMQDLHVVVRDEKGLRNLIPQ
jgi:CRP-like cAMP-binding protein